MQRAARMKRELQLFEQNPPHGISCWISKEDHIDSLEAKILGGDDTPYHGGVFKLDIQIPERYPFEPPKMKFVTPIYHPNIDNAGRICLDSLKMPPKGAWKPALNISTVLTSIQLLMAEPNPEDPLMTDIANEFKCNRAVYTRNAKEWTRKYAMEQAQNDTGGAGDDTPDPGEGGPAKRVAGDNTPDPGEGGPAKRGAGDNTPDPCEGGPAKRAAGDNTPDPCEGGPAKRAPPSSDGLHHAEHSKKHKTEHASCV